MSAYDLVAMLDDQGRFVYVSPSHEAILGYAPKELVGTVGMDLVHPDDVAPAAEQVAQQQGEDGSRVVRARAKSGAWVRLEGSIYPIGGDSALARHSIMTLRHIEAREAARLARRAEQEHEWALAAQLEAVLRNAPIGLALVDREHRFVFVNEELAAINGVPVAEHAGHTLHEVLPELASTLQPLYDQVLATGEPVRGIAIEGETAASDERRSWEASYHAVPGPDGVPEGVVAVVQETTSVRRGERERERLQRLVEVSSDFVILTAPMAAVVYLNAAGRRLAGIAPDEDVTERSMVDLVHPEHRSRLEAEVVPALETHRVWEGTFPIRNAQTGETIDLDWSAFSVDDAEYGALLGGVGRDQRPRRAAEAAALESHQSLETLFALSPIPIFSMDLERRIVRVNPAMKAVFGWPEEEMIGRTPPLESEPTDEIVAARSSLREGRTVRQRFAVRRQDGSVARVVGYGAPQLDATGAHVGSIGYLFDIEDQEQARERAEQVGRQQAGVADLSLFALTEAPVQAVLERAMELLADRLDAGFAAALELLPGGEALRLQAGVGWRPGLVGTATGGVGSGTQAGHTIETGAAVVVEDLDADGRFTISPILKEHDIVSGITAVIADENGAWGVLSAHSTERRQFSEDDVNFLSAVANVIAAKVRREQTTAALRVLTGELEQRVDARTREAETARQDALDASTAKTEFLSRMSHELRTPLNAIVGFGQLLAMDEGDPTKREAVDQILAAGLHLVGLIDELLDVSQIEAGAIQIKPTAVDVAELVSEVIALVAPLAATKGVGLSREGGTGAIARADPRRLRQVLLNLLSNAIKYNREDGSVVVTISAGDRVSIGVRDTGLGIAPVDVERIFEPFQRIPGAARVEGTGLGLAVSRGLVEAMQGTIRVESTPGVGSVFTVELRVDAPG